MSTLRHKLYRRFGVDPDPNNRNLDGSDYHIMNWVDDMIDKGMVLACVLARLQAQGRKIEDVPQEEMGTLIVEAIDDLRLADKIVSKHVDRPQ